MDENKYDITTEKFTDGNGEKGMVLKVWHKK
jgi:hypothetical protein